MNLFKILSEYPLAGQGTYRGLAYDGCRLYLTQTCRPCVAALDKCGCPVARFDTCRLYSALCYDPKEKGFWAASDGCPGRLFRLDGCFREIDCLCLKGQCRGRVTGLSFQCCGDALLVAFADQLSLIDKEGRPLWEKPQSCWLKGTLALCPWRFTWCQEGGETVVRLWNREGACVRSCRLPCGCCPEAAVYDSCGKPGDCPAFYVLITKKGLYSYLLRCVLEDCTVCRSLCPCNRLPCRCEPECGCGDSCSDALESVALMEAALSHILNAEGEKLQRVIAATDDPCTLLAVNKSVNETLVHATHLEQVLFHKLEALQEICCDPCCPET